MTKDEILAAAKKAGIFGEYGVELGAISRFAAIIEKRTIERCAEVCEVLSTKWYDEGGSAGDCAAAIRALGEQ